VCLLNCCWWNICNIYYHSLIGTTDPSTTGPSWSSSWQWDLNSLEPRLLYLPISSLACPVLQPYSQVTHPYKETSYSINLSRPSPEPLRDQSLHASRRTEDLTPNPFIESRKAHPPPSKALAAGILLLPCVHTHMPGAAVPLPGPS
jgi:hypothetical protein